MAKDLITEISEAYNIPNSIGIISKNKPLDVRDNCDTVEDFNTAATNGMDIRYHGLITTEKATGLTKICKLIDGNYVWEPLGQQGPKGDTGTFDKTTKFPELTTNAKDIPGAIIENTLEVSKIVTNMDGLKFKKITQEEYDELVNGGTIDSSITYMITNPKNNDNIDFSNIIISGGTF